MIARWRAASGHPRSFGTTRQILAPPVETTDLLGETQSRSRGLEGLIRKPAERIKAVDQHLNPCEVGFQANCKRRPAPEDPPENRSAEDDKRAAVSGEPSWPQATGSAVQILEASARAVSPFRLDRPVKDADTLGERGRRLPPHRTAATPSGHPDPLRGSAGGDWHVVAGCHVAEQRSSGVRQGQVSIPDVPQWSDARRYRHQGEASRDRHGRIGVANPGAVVRFVPVAAMRCGRHDVVMPAVLNTPADDRVLIIDTQVVLETQPLDQLP